MSVRKAGSEAGFTMIMTVLGTSFVLLLVTVAVAAVRGDLNLSQHDLNRKQAYEAARAGIEDYSFHLSKDTGYWAKCANVPEPSAVNQMNPPANERKERFVPGSKIAKYMLELIPAEGQEKCDPNNPTDTMIEHGAERQGTFRIRSTGYVGSSHVSITATFKSASFLDFVYFTELETLDPVTYGFANPSTELTAVKNQCELLYEKGRNEKPYLEVEFENQFTHKMEKEKKYCVKIQFAGGDSINGPVHTNDTMAICEEPTFGRKPSDMIEVSAKFPGWYENCSKSKPKYKGTPLAGVSPLEPPETDAKLAGIALPEFHFEGQVKICLENSIMTVGRGATCKENVEYSGGYPSNGVIYVSNKENETCPATYSPFTVTYPTSSPCGNAYVHGTYSGQLTIGTQNDIIVDGSVCWSTAPKCSEFPTGNEMLGLIANNFIRIYHDYPTEVINPATYNSKCEPLEGKVEGKIENIVIDAAVLSINHSIIVDHYKCGSFLGTLRLNGAFSQRFRGPVGTAANTGYLKSYNYDDRLKYQEPPSFIQPEKLPWLIGRETIG
jgi:hypothetical protein